MLTVENIFWSVVVFVSFFVIMFYLAAQELKCEDCGYLNTKVEEKHDYLEIYCPRCETRFNKEF